MSQQAEEIEDLVRNPHDGCFKTTMGHLSVARDFFQRFLPPKLRQHIDLDCLSLSQNSYVGRNYTTSSSDVLYKTLLNGTDAYLYVLTEHQSSIDRLMPLRLWEYELAIWRDHMKQHPASVDGKTLPLIIPLVFYAGKSPWNASLDLRDLIDAPDDLIDAVLYQPAYLIDATVLSDEALQVPSGAAMMAYFMKHARYRDLCVYVPPVLKLLKAVADGGKEGMEVVVSLLHYGVVAGHTDRPEAFVKMIQEGLTPEVGDEMMSLAETWKAAAMMQGIETGMQEGMQRGIQQGMQQGIQRGIQQGMQAGEKALLVKLLMKKFGPVVGIYRERIETASPELLLEWGEQILDAQNIDDIFK